MKGGKVAKTKTKKVLKAVKKGKAIKKAVKVPKAKTKAARPVRKQVVKKVAPKAKAPRPKKEKKQAGYKGYTEDELKKFKELLVENNKLTNDQLKAILRANSQSMSGTKDVLVDRVADGEVLGAMPRCSKCGGGYLKWNNKKGEYWCNGYMDDTVWKFCHFKGDKSSVTRTPWIKP